MALSDLTFLHSGFTPKCAASVDKKFEGYQTLQYGERGGVELFYGEQRYLLDEDTPWFWTAYPGPHIRFHAAPGLPWWRHRYVAFQGPRVARWIADGLWTERPQPAPINLAAVYPARFDELIRLSRQPPADRWSLARAVNLLEAILIELAEDRARTMTASVVPEPWLAELIARIEEAETIPILTEEPSPLDYAGFARAHGMALTTLRRRFRAATGAPLHEWAVQSRIARARHLLGETDMPVKAVAAQLGYRDVYFFTRQFRQTVGVPPAAYRRSRQG